MFDEYQISNTLQKKARFTLMNYLVDFIDDEYEGNASKVEIGWICQATVALFPCLQDEHGGIVRIN